MSYILLKFALFLLLIWTKCLPLLTNVVAALDQDAVPKSYSIRIAPDDLEYGGNFTGEVWIEVFVKNSTEKISLHSKGLDIRTVSVRSNDIEFRAYFEIDEENELLRVNTDPYLVYDGTYKVHIRYNGVLNENTIGFYRTWYKVNKEMKWLASTQFEPTYARMAFPCFDEPKFRTPFSVSVGRFKHQHVISNMPVKRIDNDNEDLNRVWDTFYATPPMPTYLLTITVSEFHRNRNKEGTVSVWSRQNVINDTNYILSKSELLLHAMEGYFGIPYMLPKLDLIAIPHMKFLAMENWGANTYKERFLLHKEELISAKNLKKMTSVVAHEISHQWFGGYVTPLSWNQTWLNEAFATYLEYFLTSKVETTWSMDQLFATEVTQYSLFEDEVSSHHPLMRSLTTTEEIVNNFDFITYKKGASILRMLEHMVSPKMYQKSLKRYLQTGHDSGGLVEPEDLWRSFEEELENTKILPASVLQIMNTWTQNRGYPLITVEKRPLSNSLLIKQAAYSSPRSFKITPNQDWIIPITYTTKYAANFSHTLPTIWCFPNSSNEISVTRPNNEWILFNIQQTGYYRITYDSDNWLLLIEQLQEDHRRIHVLNRAQLIDDSFSLATDEKIEYDIPFCLGTYLDSETEMLPLFSALKKFRYLYSQYETTNVGPHLKEYIVSRLMSQYRSLTFRNREEDDHLTKIVRSEIINTMCNLNYSDCVSKANEYYQKYSNNISGIPADVKSAVFCTMLHDNDTLWDNLWTLYKKTDVPFEQEAVLSSIGCINNVNYIEKLLDKFIMGTDRDFRKEDIAYITKSAFHSVNGVTAMLRFIHEVIPKMNEQNEENKENVMAIAKKIYLFIKTEDQMQILKMTIDEFGTKEGIPKELMDTLKTTYMKSSKYAEMNRRRLEEIKFSIEKCDRSSLDPNDLSTTPDPIDGHSFATKIIPSAFLVSIVGYYINIR